MITAPIERQAALRMIEHTLAADFACDSAHFTTDGVCVIEARELAGRRRYPWRARSFAMATMGRGVVIACSADRLAWANAHLGQLDRDELFQPATLGLIDALIAPDQQRLAGPILRLVCAHDTFRAVNPPPGIAVELVQRAQIHELYAHQGFHNALGYQLDSPRPDMLAAIARDHGSVIGAAGASADSDQLWQIGVDVQACYRGRGIGAALVSQITNAVLAAGRVPYYSTWASNLASSNLALRLGYWLGWVEVAAFESD